MSTLSFELQALKINTYSMSAGRCTNMGRAVGLNTSGSPHFVVIYLTLPYRLRHAVIQAFSVAR